MKKQKIEIVNQDKKDTKIIIILDSSGSMRRIDSSTISSLNGFLTEQRDMDGNASMTFVKFNDQIDIVYEDKDLSKVSELTNKDYMPDGYTALYDAVGITLSKAKDKYTKDDNVIVVILTDGEENASRSYKASDAKKIINEVESQLNWKVLFIGANIDSFSEGSKLGVSSNYTSNFSHDNVGIQSVMCAVSDITKAYRSSSNVVYADGTTANANDVDLSRLYNEKKTATTK